MTPTPSSRIAAFCDPEKRRRYFAEWARSEQMIIPESGDTWGCNSWTRACDKGFSAGYQTASSQAAELLRAMLKDMEVMAAGLEQAVAESDASGTLYHAAIALYSPYRAIEMETEKEDA